MDEKDDWLIDCFGIYTVSAIFQTCYGGKKSFNRKKVIILIFYHYNLHKKIVYILIYIPQQFDHYDVISRSFVFKL